MLRGGWGLSIWIWYRASCKRSGMYICEVWREAIGLGKVLEQIQEQFWGRIIYDATSISLRLGLLSVRVVGNGVVGWIGVYVGLVLTNTDRSLMPSARTQFSRSILLLGLPPKKDQSLSSWIIKLRVWSIHAWILLVPKTSTSVLGHFTFGAQPIWAEIYLAWYLGQ